MGSHHQCTSVAGSGFFDAPTNGDYRRIRNARRSTRDRCREIDAARAAAIFEAFRRELGATVRSASPLLIAILAIEGLSLDDVVEKLEPTPGWPIYPRPSGAKTTHAVYAHLQGHSKMGISRLAAGSPKQIAQRRSVARSFIRTAGGYLDLNVIDHSLEIEAKIGAALITTCFGELHVQLDDEFPATLLAASVGRLLEEIVDYDAWRGRGWRIAETTVENFGLGSRLIVVTGSVDYRMPWAR